MNKFLGSSVIGFCVLLGGIGLLTSISTIDPGYNGIVYNRNGGIEDETLGQGWHIVSPFKKIIRYPVSTETAYYNNNYSDDDEGRRVDDRLTIGTKDGKTIDIEMQLFYHMEVEKLGKIFTKFRGASAEKIAYGYMKQNTQRIVNDISSRYSIVDLAGELKPQFNREVAEALKAFFAPEGIIIEQAGLGRVEPDEETQRQIQAVTDAQYREKQAQYEKEVAKAQAEKILIETETKAKAKRMEADAVAYYNEKVTQSASKDVVALKWIEKWDGKVPQIQSGEGMMLLPTK